MSYSKSLKEEDVTPLQSITLNSTASSEFPIYFPEQFQGNLRDSLGCTEVQYVPRTRSFFSLPQTSYTGSMFASTCSSFKSSRSQQFFMDSTMQCGLSSDTEGLREDLENVPSFTFHGSNGSHASLSNVPASGDVSEVERDLATQHWLDEIEKPKVACCNLIETRFCNVDVTEVPGLNDLYLTTGGTPFLSGRDMKNFIIGIPSASFSIDLNNETLPSLKLLLPYCHTTKTDEYIDRLFRMCHSFLETKRLSHEFKTCPSGGSLMKALSSAMDEYLYCYETNVLSVDLEGDFSVDAFLLRFSGVWGHLRSFLEICVVMSDLREKLHKQGPNAYESVQLLSSIYELVGKENNDPLRTGMSLIIKHCFGLYFSFLRHWLFDGIVDDDSFEFCLKTDSSYAFATDETFWTKYFCDDMDDNSVPSFLKDLRRDIFICGKSFSLLRSSCHTNVLFSIGKDLPDFLVGFSQKRNDEIEKGNLKIMMNRLEVLLQDLDNLVTVQLPDQDRQEWWKETIMRIGVNKKLKQSLLLKLPDEYKFCPEENIEATRKIVRLESHVEDFPCLEIKTIEDILQSNIAAENTSVCQFGKPLEPWIESYPTRDVLVNRLIVRIAKCLDDSYQETKDVVMFLQDKIIQEAISRPITALATAQIEIVNRCTLQYLFADRKLYLYFEELADLFLFRDPEFRQKFSFDIFSKINAVDTAAHFFSPQLLHSLLTEALPKICAKYQGTIRLESHVAPEAFPRYRLAVVDYLSLSYQVPFPCNIIITDVQLEDYNKIMRFLIQLQLPFSCLKNMWFTLKMLRKDNQAICDSTQYAAVLQFRNQMCHFVGVLNSFVSYMILSVEWTNLMTFIREKVKNIEDLRQTHNVFIQNAVKICLLTPVDAPLHRLVQNALNSVLRFHKFILEGEWYYNNTTEEWNHHKFTDMQRNFKSFMVHMKVLKESWFQVTGESQSNSGPFPKELFIASFGNFSCILQL